VINGDGFNLFQEVLSYAYYDGALSGAARSDFKELKFVWFTALAVREWLPVRVYSLATIDESSYQKLRRFSSFRGNGAKRGSLDLERLPSGETLTTPQIDDIILRFPAPTWFCLSVDNLETVSILRRLPALYTSEIDQVIRTEDMPFQSPVYEMWLGRILDFGAAED
jgi:hypothetical protein